MSEDNNTVVTLKVRVTPEFREKIIDAAKENNRSMNQEIVYRLEQSFTNTSDSTYDRYDFSHTKSLSKIKQGYIATNLDERRYLAKLAAEKALAEISAKEFIDVMFNKLNSEGLALTVEEVDKSTGHKKTP